MLIHDRYYLWAAVAIWLIQILGRTFWKISAFRLTETWFKGCPTTVQNLGADMLKMDVLVPQNWMWSPGQHVFLRFPSIGILQNHPFTIASIPSTGGGTSRTEKRNGANDDANTLS